MNQNTKIWNAVLVPIVVMANTVVCHASPSISNISGTFSSGQSVTIAGSSFGTKSPAAPLVWDTFESGSNGTAIQSVNAILGQWDTGAGSDNVYYTNTIGYGGSSKAARHQFTESQYNSSLSKNGTFSVLYLDFKRYYPSSNGNPSNYKPYRLYGNDDALQLTISQACGWSNAELYVNGLSEDNDTEWIDLIPSMDSWRHYQLLFKESSAGGVADGVIKMYLDGTQYGLNSSNQKTRIYSSQHFDQVRVGHFFDVYPRDNCDPNDNSVVYSDNVYIDTTWARVEIGNANTYSASTRREIQIPTTWSSDGKSITMTVNTGTFAEGSTAYLYVFDSSGTPNALGYAVIIGSGGEPPAQVAGGRLAGSLSGGGVIR